VPPQNPVDRTIVDVSALGVAVPVREVGSCRGVDGGSLVPGVSKGSCAHALPDISILESRPTPESGFDIGSENAPYGLRKRASSGSSAVRTGATSPIG
jgi:hypothetical protein